MAHPIQKNSEYLTFPTEGSQLAVMFDEFGIARRGTDRNQVHRADFENVGMSYEFFKTFAALTRNGKNSNAQHKTFDAKEERQLLAALKIFDDNLSFDLENTSRPFRISDVDLVRDKINAMAKDPCWLLAASLKLAVFGVANGQQNLFRKVKFKNYVPVEKKSSPAKKFSCPFIPQLAEHTTRLAYRPEQMPREIRGAAASTLLISGLKNDQQGTGVAAYQAGYLLTAHHLVEKNLIEIGHHTYAPVSLQVGDKTIDAMAELLPLPSKSKDPNLDLAILYIPELASRVAPVPIADPEVKTPRELRVAQHRSNLRMWEREWEARLMQAMVKRAAGFDADFYPKVYMLGYPFQKGDPELLVTVGKSLGKDELGRSVTNAAGLPGNSGSPFVDSQGNLVGVMTEMVTNPSIDVDAMAASFDFEANIVGSAYHGMEDWGAEVKAAIDQHQRSAQKSTPNLRHARRIQKTLSSILKSSK